MPTRRRTQDHDTAYRLIAFCYIAGSMNTSRRSEIPFHCGYKPVTSCTYPAPSTDWLPALFQNISAGKDIRILAESAEQQENGKSSLFSSYARHSQVPYYPGAHSSLLLSSVSHTVYDLVPDVYTINSIVFFNAMPLFPSQSGLPASCFNKVFHLFIHSVVTHYE